MAPPISTDKILRTFHIILITPSKIQYIVLSADGIPQLVVNGQTKQKHFNYVISVILYKHWPYVHCF